MNQKQEQRKHTRIRKELPLKIKAAEADFITQTQNVSASGAFFRIEKPIPLMTRLAVTLLIPSGEKGKRTRTVVCNGVVVRCEPMDPKNPAGEHHIAVYFTALKDADKKSLTKFVQMVMEGNT